MPTPDGGSPRAPRAPGRYIAGRQIPALDGVRGIAVLIVILHHGQLMMPDASPGWILLKSAFRLGWAGVDLFFVLSGFLITGILLDTRPASNYFQSFYARRILRIFPLYYVALTGLLLLGWACGPWLQRLLPPSDDRGFYFLFLNNWRLLLHHQMAGNTIGHFWSLAVEEQFYLMWSLCVWLVPSRYLGRICAATFVGVLALRVGLLWHGGPSQAIVENTFTRMDTLLAGAACAIIVRRKDLLARIGPWMDWVAAVSFGGLGAIFLATQDPA